MYIFLLFYLIIYKFIIVYLLLIRQVAATLRMNWATNSSSLLMSAGTHEMFILLYMCGFTMWCPS